VESFFHLFEKEITALRDERRKVPGKKTTIASKEIHQHLKTIFYENEEYFSLLTSILNQHEDVSEALSPITAQLRTIKEMHFEHLQEAFRHFD